MKKFLISAFLLVSIAGSAKPLADSVAMTIGNKQVTIAEFLYMANKNNAQNLNNDKELKSFVELFRNFKLKVVEAETEGIDKTKSFDDELSHYRSELINGYLSDKNAEELVIEKEYNRLKELVDFDHILFNLPEKSVSKDTVIVYEQAMAAYKKLQLGESFETVAKELMQSNPGKAGYERVRSLPPLKTPKMFEDHVYGMKQGELSMPFRSQAGYHIVRINKKGNNPGRVQVAHILIPFSIDSTAGNEDAAKIKIDDIYNQIQAGADFSELAKKYSSDKASAKDGGLLPIFGIGDMVEPFEKQAYALHKPNEISLPFKSQYGYHIIKMVKKLDIETLSDVQEHWHKKMAQGEWNFELYKGFDDYLKKEYNYKFYPQSYAELQMIVSDYFPTDDGFIKQSQSLNKTLASIGGIDFKQKEFVDYMYHAPYSAKTYSGDFMQEIYYLFVREIMTSMEKNNLYSKHPEIDLLLNEYRDGILLFSISNEKIWSKPTEQQKEIEETWIKELESKYPTVINWKAIKKAIKKQ